MANVKLTADVIASEALMLLDNNLVFANQVYRGYESGILEVRERLSEGRYDSYS